jgi:hypothetical protein
MWRAHASATESQMTSARRSAQAGCAIRIQSRVIRHHFAHADQGHRLLDQLARIWATQTSRTDSGADLGAST